MGRQNWLGLCLFATCITSSLATKADASWLPLRHSVSEAVHVLQVVLRPAQQKTQWLVVSSRATYAEANAVAQSFAPTLGPTAIVRSRNGAFAIIAGTLNNDKAKANVKTLKDLRLIPQDAFLSDGVNIEELLSHSYSSGASTDLMTQSALIVSVRRLQIALSRMKIYAGPTDGLVGPETVNAFATYTTAFGVPSGEYLTEYALSSIEQTAQDGFRTASERQAAFAMGFQDASSYAEALKGGFSNASNFAQAKNRGFQTQRDYDDAQSGGFRNFDEYQQGRLGSFATADELRAATRVKIGTSAEYTAFRTSGFSDAETFFRAREKGYQERSTYERFIATELKAARSKASALLDDAQTFIRLNPSVPNLVDIADKAASLSKMISSGATQGIEQASSQLAALLSPLPNYLTFAAAREKERFEKLTLSIREAKNEIETTQASLNRWIASNISSPKTPQILAQLKALGEVVGSSDIESLQSALREAKAVASRNDLEIKSSNVSDLSNTSNDDVTNGSAPFAVTTTNAALLQGALSDVVALYNASPSAPHLRRTLSGGFSFAEGNAIICVVGIESTPIFSHELKQILATYGVTSLEVSICKAGNALDHDILLLNRKAFLESKPSFAISYVDAVEAKKLRVFQGIDFPTLAARQEETEGLVRAIGDGVAAGIRRGFGAIELATPNGDFCISVESDLGLHQDTLRNVAAMTDGKRLGLQRPFANPDELYSAILREQCRVVYGKAQTLSELSQALKRDEVKFSFFPTWLDEGVLADRLSKKVAEEQAKVKRAETARLEADEVAKIAERQRQEDAKNAVAIEAELQSQYGPAATARVSKLSAYLQSLAIGQSARGGQAMAKSYPGFEQWISLHHKDGWEVTSVDPSVQDFGAINWKNRPLEALVSKAIVKSKSRERGEYRDDCFLFAIVFDDEFEMIRDPLEGTCSEDAEKFAEWKVGHEFQSRWRVASTPR